MLTLLMNADVHAPDPLGLQHLLIGGERILWMGRTEPELGGGLSVERVDLGGARVIPGLIDGHVHLTGGGGEAGVQTRVPAPTLTAYTRAGVTTAIGVLGTDDCIRTPAELLAAARTLHAEGLSAWCHTGGYHLPAATLTGSIRGDIVHIDRFIGVGEVAISDHRSSQPTLEELLRVASEAHVAGLMTGKAGVLHLHVGDGARGLELIRRAVAESELPARVFNPTHVNRRTALFDEALEAARLGCTVDLTAFPVADGEDAYAADAALLRFLDSDAPSHRVTISSDGGGCLPVFDAEGRVRSMEVGASMALAETLASLVRSGLPLAAAVAPMTSNVADLLRLPRKGRLAVGADADLVVLNSDGGVCDVMARGAWHLRAGTVQRRGTFEAI